MPLEHPRLGPLTFEQGLWSGETQVHGRAVRFHVAGSSSAPHTCLLENLFRVLEEFQDMHGAAVDFIMISAGAGEPGIHRFPGIGPDDIVFDSLDFLWEREPHVFFMDFDLREDVGAIWRVQFEAGKPRFLTRDS